MCEWVGTKRADYAQWLKRIWAMNACDALSVSYVERFCDCENAQCRKIFAIDSYGNYIYCKSLLCDEYNKITKEHKYFRDEVSLLSDWTEYLTVQYAMAGELEYALAGELE